MVTDSKITESRVYGTLTADNAAVLLIDHQVGFMQAARAIDSTVDVTNNVLGLAKTARVFGLPVLLTTNDDTGPNGDILPELRALFPRATVIRRPGMINAWHWPAVRQAVADSGRGNLIIAAVMGDADLQFPALDAARDGYDVHAVIDAGGAWSAGAREIIMARLTSAGVKVTTWVSVACELQEDWQRPTGPALAEVFRAHLPSWNALVDTDAADRDRLEHEWSAPGAARVMSWRAHD